MGTEQGYQRDPLPPPTHTHTHTHTGSPHWWSNPPHLNQKVQAIGAAVKPFQRWGQPGASSTMACVIFHLAHNVLHVIAKPLLFDSHLTMMYKMWIQTRQAEPAAEFPSSTSEFSSSPAAHRQKQMVQASLCYLIGWCDVSGEDDGGVEGATVSISSRTSPSLAFAKPICWIPAPSILHLDALSLVFFEAPSSAARASVANNSIVGGQAQLQPGKRNFVNNLHIGHS